MNVSIKLNDWKEGEVTQRDSIVSEAGGESAVAQIRMYAKEYQKQYPNRKVITMTIEVKPIEMRVFYVETEKEKKRAK